MDTRRVVRSIAGLSALVLTSACVSTEAKQPVAVSDDAVLATRGQVGGGPGSSVSTGSYAQFGDCDELMNWLRQELSDRVTPWGIDQFGWHPEMWGRLGVPGTTVAAPIGDAPADTAAPAADAAPVAPTGGGTSQTNTQEAGVDEGDIAETDGRFVYSIIDNTLRSVDLQNSSLLAEMALPEGPHQMILAGDDLLVATTVWTAGDETSLRRYAVADGVPSLVAHSQLEGRLLASRAVDGVVRLVMSNQLTDRIPFVQAQYGTEEANERAVERNLEIIADLQADTILPRMYDVLDGGASGPLRTAVPCDKVGHPGRFSGFGFTWLATVDLNTDPSQGVVGAAAAIADAATAYASQASLVVGAYQWPDVSDGFVPVNPAEQETSLHMFTFDGADAAYTASGSVPGVLLNQYALSDHEGFLRVATTRNSAGFGGSAGASIHVLERREGELATISTLNGLAPGEQIQSVRYDGDTAYVVTFLQTDPLFVIDLSDPRAPRLDGELKIPGFSTYLHPVSDDLVLGVGFAGNDSGLTGGTQISLFDVSDRSVPKLLGSLPIGNETEANFDPHAFLYWPETGHVVVPKELVCAEFGDPQQCSSAVVGRVDTTARTLTEDGRLFHWFPIRRTMVANGDLVTLSAGGLKRWTLPGFTELADVRFDIPGTDAELSLP